MITPIEQLAPISGVKSAKPVEAVRGDQSLFGAVFQSAVDNVKQADLEVREAQYLLSTGVRRADHCRREGVHRAGPFDPAAEQGAGRLLGTDADQPLMKFDE